MEILKGVDFNQYNFKYLLIESKKIELLKLFSSKKYSLIDQLSKQDYLFRLMIISFITPVLDEKIFKILIKRINEKYNKFDFEWIFIDDHSTDKSYQILSDFSKESKIKLLKNSGKGKIDAINLGVKSAQGKFIKLVELMTRSI